ncbi:MAG TPA: Rrf2 family transcriptional regulator [Rhodothermales bacterium]|nr:Rrf2 family transcriptional regulator [Rhodothermales bacterium]
MLLSNACEYGLRAALYLASLKQEGYVPIRKISGELDISFPFLTKIFQMLTQAGLLTSYRGPNGGVALSRSADRIRLREIILAIDGPALFEECVLGLPGCGEQKPCPLHARWAVERDRIEQMFAASTLAEMADKIGSPDVRLKSLC